MRKAIFLFFILILLAGCSSATATATKANPNPTPNSSDGYPAQGSSTVSPQQAGYPAPTDAVMPTAGATATTNAQLGSVTGYVLVRGKPADGIMYLAAMIKDTSGKESLAGLNPSKSPWCVPDATGKFSFINVQPGRYALVFDDTSQSYVLPKPDTKEVIVITVENAKVVDLGKLDYNTLPPQ